MATQVVFRKVSPSKSLEAFVKEQAMKIEKIIPGVYKMRVIIDGKNKSDAAYDFFTVSASVLRKRGQFFSVQRDVEINRKNGMLYSAVKGCMDALTRSIEHHLEKRRAVLFHRTRKVTPTLSI